jgi:FixJ family two-component response regulator
MHHRKQDRLAQWGAPRGAWETLMIAIIDDDEEVRSATENLMKSCGLDVCVFGSGQEFLDSAAATQTRCVITDVQMPGMSGIELSRALLDRGLRIPTIFITAYPQERLRRQAAALGAIAFLSKPFDAGKLMEFVGAALDKSG